MYCGGVSAHIMKEYDSDLVEGKRMAGIAHTLSKLHCPEEGYVAQRLLLTEHVACSKPTC